MIKFKNFIGVLFLSLGLFLPSVMNVFAAKDIQGGACMQDYYNFILSVKPPELQGKVFTDVLKPWCQVNDLLPLYEEYDAIKEDYKNAAAVCGAQVNEYQYELKRVLLEQYFVRNLNAEVRNTDDISQIEERESAIFTLLKEDMKNRFVEKNAMVKEEELDAMFETWQSKYSDSLFSYASCQEGPTWDLYESWFDFQDTLSELDFQIETPQEKSFIDAITPEVDNSGLEDGFSEGVQNVTDAWNKFNSNFNYSQEIREESNIDESESLPFDFNTYLDMIKSDENEEDIILASDKRMAEYELLYGEISALSTTRSVMLLDRINQTINMNNVQDFPAILDALSGIYGRQCSAG